MKLAWLTDIHLNFISYEERNAFYELIVEKNIDGILITGDIAEATTIYEILEEMVDYIKKPIYFVLGNHDFYKGTINKTKQTLKILSSLNPLINYLPYCPFKFPNLLLIGQDGWADARIGEPYSSRVFMNDWYYIKDLKRAHAKGKDELFKKIQKLSDIDSLKMRKQIINSICTNTKKVIILTHIPPFQESAKYKNKISNKDYLPFYTNKSMGDTLLEVAKIYTNIKFLVLCGHTHSSSIYRPLKNLTIKSGNARYYSPEIQEIIEV